MMKCLYFFQNDQITGFADKLKHVTTTASCRVFGNYEYEVSQNLSSESTSGMSRSSKM